MLKKIIALFAFLFLISASPAFATHSWGGYHWARTANPFTLKLGDNVNSTWDSYLLTTASDWSQSTVLDTIRVTGQANPKNCRPTSGRVEVCNSKYGNNGWLGIAQIWVSSSHITQGITKMNDTYFNTASYNTPAWRQMVICQEIGHTFGLDHQDENFNNTNLGTCMDYTSDPNTNQHPNAHDYEELGLIYAHLDSFTTLRQTISRNLAKEIDQANLDDSKEWGKRIKGDRKVAVYERNFGGGDKVFTFVIWAE
ncbi:hypothetical protein A2975_02330 [Candidatus Woesebacteria bacterium RIFCSPLOWO2_01_FULL_44_14]|uniref:Peptidase M10 metallopeptidase domain-containing protein n=1 Tax=Candidatus Woesebacteria bacterium RIFCSPLOWO2_01_FULL_44_14 TaxID=1802525 RepID=A0A1F8C122_9BACT|nr:MAG: hypothetical protein A2975_02330 [Candidatus Woesebacteria bacterium RIFCSPLOWO2_01_FULL_44_14]